MIYKSEASRIQMDGGEWHQAIAQLVVLPGKIGVVTLPLEGILRHHRFEFGFQLRNYRLIGRRIAPEFDIGIDLEPKPVPAPFLYFAIGRDRRQYIELKRGLGRNVF